MSPWVLAQAVSCPGGAAPGTVPAPAWSAAGMVRRRRARGRGLRPPGESGAAGVTMTQGPCRIEPWAGAAATAATPTGWPPAGAARPAQADRGREFPPAPRSPSLAPSRPGRGGCRRQCLPHLTRDRDRDVPPASPRAQSDMAVTVTKSLAPQWRGRSAGSQPECHDHVGRGPLPPQRPLPSRPCRCGAGVCPATAVGGAA